MKTYLYIGAIACVLGFISLGLAFTGLGVYALISSIVLGIAALAFASAQKKKNNLKAVIYVTAAAYTLIAISLTIFIGGLIYSAVNV